MNNKAVILGNNYYIGLSAIRCLGEKGIHTVAADYSEEDRYGAESKYCSEKILVPHYRKESGKFIEALIDYAKKQDVKPVLIPCHDSYLEVIDAHLDEVKKYYLLPQTEKGLATEVMNKDTLHALAMEKGVKVPESVRVNEPNFREKVTNEIQFPCLVKPFDSPSFVATFRKKIFKVHTMDELEEAVAKADKAGLEVFIQRIIPGFDDHMHTFDAYLNQDSKVTHWTTAQKLRQYPINFGASVYTIHKYIPELYDIGTNFLEAIKYKGFGEIEFKKDAETGEFYLIEINARITNFNHLLYKVGLNFPYITYMELIGKPIEPQALKETTNRAFWYGYEDLLAVKDYIKTGQLSVGQVIKSLFRPKAYAIWSWQDPKPAFAFMKTRTSKLFRRGK
ncbi:carboxylate--amine ligase [Ornithinibacillus salinisoli]|uniref:Carboxylate--amine ligase n=1 Tax=Ornithinibacillus salinisoli TaxID=1848459 RepID=A0ABW4VY14_9BACI